MRYCCDCANPFSPLDEEPMCPTCFANLKSEFNAVKDSGDRREFATGSRRDVRTGKGRFDLLPAYVLLRDAKHMENGAVKYGDRNWERGQPLSVYLDSAFRHLICWMMGMRDEDHLAAARWNLGCLIWTEEMIRRGKLPAELDDLPPPDKQEGE